MAGKGSSSWKNEVLRTSVEELRGYLSLVSPSHLRSGSLPFVDGRLRMIIAPVEPVILERGNTIQALAQRGTRDGAALKVPLARGRGIEQDPGFPRGRRCGVCRRSVHFAVGWRGVRCFRIRRSRVRRLSLC